VKHLDYSVRPQQRRQAGESRRGAALAGGLRATEDLLAAGDPDEIPKSLGRRRAWGCNLIWFGSSAYPGVIFDGY
jgi:hypothetical protein